MRFLLLLTLVLVGLGGCGFGPGKRPGAEDAAAKTAARKEAELVRVARPELGELMARLEITARVGTLEQAEVYPRIDGIVVEVRVEEGADVAAGDLLARIEDDQARIAVAKAAVALAQAELAARTAALARAEAEARLAAMRTTLEKRRSELERAQAQHKKGAIADQDLERAVYDHETATSEAEQAELRLQQAEQDGGAAELTVKDARIAHEKALLDLSFTRITAPIGGRVIRRTIRVGQKARLGESLFTIADLDTLICEPKVPEKDLRVLAEGLPVRVETTSYPGVSYRGRVAMIASEIETEGGSLRVRIALEPGEPKLRPGMFVSGHIETERREGILLVPKKALLFDRERPYVFVVENDEGTRRVRKVYLRRGLQDAERVEYLPPEGRGPELDAESLVVVVGLDKLVDGAEVRLEGETAPETRPEAQPEGTAVPKDS